MITPQLSQLVATRMPRILSPQLDRNAAFLHYERSSFICNSVATRANSKTTGIMIFVESICDSFASVFTRKDLNPLEICSTCTSFANFGPRPLRRRACCPVGGLAVFAALTFLSWRFPPRPRRVPYIVTYDHYWRSPAASKWSISRPSPHSAGAMISTPTGWSSSTEPQPGGRRSSISTGRPLSATARYSPVSGWENRFRLLKNEHMINPVLYVEYEQISEADKIMKEVEGHDVEADHVTPNCDPASGAQS